MGMDCLYCLKSHPFTEEHVLTRALAGAGENWVLKDAVCTNCNDLFSRYERAWTSEPGIAMMRIACGPAGRTRKGQAYQFHPSELMFLEVDGDPVSYEVDILPGVSPRFRYQVIDAGGDVFPVVSDRSDAERFAKAWKAFIARPEVTIQKGSANGKAVYRVASLRLSGVPAIVNVEQRSKPAGAWWDTFGDRFGRSTAPRMSLDPFGRIRFRTERIKQIPKLLERIFGAGEIGRTGAVHKPGDYRVVCRGVYDIGKIHRAIAKTLVNYMVDQRGRGYAELPAFRPILDYCIGGPDFSGPGPFVGSVFEPTGIATIDTLPTERHGMALISNGVRVVGILKLYGADHSYRVHLGRAPDPQPFMCSMRIDYNGSGRVAV